MADMQKWQKLRSDYALKERWITVRSDAYRTPAGAVLDPYYILEYPDWVDVVVIDKNLRVVMLKHYRPGADDFIPEIPVGVIDATDADAAAAARRELQEELGYRGGELFALGSFWSNPGIQNNHTYGFLAIGGEIDTTTSHDEGETMSIYTMSLPELLDELSLPESAAHYQAVQVAFIHQAVNFIRRSEHPAAQALQKQLATVAR